MPRRRTITGTPLLLASAAVSLAVGCSGGTGKNNGPVVTGNLMPPPTFTTKVCVDTEPETATVKVAGMIREERCSDIETWDSMVQVEVSAPDHTTKTEMVEVTEGGTSELKVTLEAMLQPEQPPVGNLMPPPAPPIDIAPPPPEPPVGNLMPPPDREFDGLKLEPDEAPKVE